MLAGALPVPIRLTKGQATRDYLQQRFEKETAKDPNAGAPLRERFAEQNEKILANFDAWADQTGAEAPSPRAVGAAVDAPLVRQMKADKAQMNVTYAKANKSPEAAAQVDHTLPVTVGEGDSAIVSTPLDYLNEQITGLPSTGLTDAARQYAVKLGIASLQDGELVPRPATIRQMENWRKAINAATGYEPADIRQSAIVKSLIDGQTEPVAGPLYRQARATRQRFAQNYEDHAVISKLLGMERGTTDHQVVLEDVFDHSVLKTSGIDDLRTLRRVLHRSGDDGKQAWRELQGATVRWIKERAAKNIATDERGNSVLSPAGLNSAVEILDHDGRLDFMFGKKGAQQMRDVNDLAKAVYTAPPGAVNTSNTASVLLAALGEAGVMGGAFGLPVPVLTGLRQLAVHVKNRRIQQRVQEALNEAKRRPPSPPVPQTVH